MSGGSKQKTQSTSSNTIDPASLGLLTQNYNAAKAGTAAYQPYTGELTAGFTPTQLAAQKAITGIANNTSGQTAINGAQTAVQGVLSSPVNGQVTAPTVTSGLLSNTDLSPYMNPYTSSVIDTTNNQIEQQRQAANMTDNQKAAAAGAFGGSRSGVANALTNNYYDQNTASTDAALNQANFSQAQGAALNDINNTNQTGEFNATNNLNAQQSSIQNALAAQGLTLNAAGQVVSLANAGLNDATQRAGLLSAVGDAQQQQKQTTDTNAYQAYLQQQQAAAAKQQQLNSALGLIPVQQTVSSTGTNKTSTNPGLAGILGSLGSVAQGAGALFA